MKTIFSILFILLFNFGFAQTQIKKSSISTGGGSATSGNTQVVYGIGETAIQEQSQGNTSISEGFIGPDIIAALGITDYGQLQGVSVFPNPVQEDLQIQWAKTGTYEVYFYDIAGKLIWQKNVSKQQQATYNLSRWQAAVYLMIIIDKKHHQSANLKIQKL